MAKASGAILCICSAGLGCITGDMVAGDIVTRDGVVGDHAMAKMMTHYLLRQPAYST